MDVRPRRAGVKIARRLRSTAIPGGRCATCRFRLPLQPLPQPMRGRSRIAPIPLMIGCSSCMARDYTAFAKGHRATFPLWAVYCRSPAGGRCDSRTFGCWWRKTDLASKQRGFGRGGGFRLQATSAKRRRARRNMQLSPVSPRRPRAPQTITESNRSRAAPRATRFAGTPGARQDAPT